MTTKRFLAGDLYQYLLSLHSVLEDANEKDAAARVQHLSKFSSGSTSEFYGEARLLLPRILETTGTSLPPQERARLHETILGIEHEFDLIGGG